MLGQNGIVLEVGQKIHYRNPSMPHPEATYEGIVEKEYPYFYQVLGTPIISTLSIKNKEALSGDPIPYRFCVPKYLDSRSERVYVVKETEQMSA